MLCKYTYVKKQTETIRFLVILLTFLSWRDNYKKYWSIHDNKPLVQN